MRLGLVDSGGLHGRIEAGTPRGLGRSFTLYYSIVVDHRL